MADEIQEKKRKNKKRKVQQSMAAQADTNDNQRSKRNQAPLKTKQINYVESTDEFYTDEDGNYESASSKSKSKRARNNGHSDFHINLPSTRNSEDTLRLKICEKLIAEIMKNEMAGPFLKPVSKRDVSCSLLSENKFFSIVSILTFIELLEGTRLLRCDQAANGLWFDQKQDQQLQVSELSENLG
jgi:hypothetical protein